MLYSTYQAQHTMLEPWRVMSQGLADALHHMLPAGPAQSSLEELLAGGVFARSVAAANEVFTRLKLTHARPAFDIPSVISQGREYAIAEEKVMSTPFGTLLRFRKEGGPEQPRVLLVAPMSGHFATLLRDTVRTLLQDHDVYITDWHNARDVPLRHGPFSLDDYTDHLIRFLDRMGPGSHLMAICQPCVAALAATSLMAQDAHPAQPRSLTLMAGPIDCRVNPTGVNELATSKPMSWFEENMIHKVPWTQRGAGRKVYPGFVQLSAFMAMNQERHKKAFEDMYAHIAAGEHEKAAHTLYVLDEPTVGLHLADVEKLIRVLHRLVDGGHSVVVIEHDLDVIAEADWIIDMGPEGGTGGGKVAAQGTPDEIVGKKTHTGVALKGVLHRATRPN